MPGKPAVVLLIYVLKEAKGFLVIGDQHVLSLTVVGEHHLVILPANT